MRIKFLGTGSAFTLKNFQTNIAIEQNGKWLLLDAGGDIRFSLNEAGLSYKDIDAVYISHLHSDHAGGIETIAFCSYFTPDKEKPKLFGSGELLRRGWEDTWKGGLESLQGKLLTLNDFFDVTMVKPNGFFEWEGIQFTLVQSIHIMNGYCIVPCYGLIIKPKALSTKTIYWTSDCQFCHHQILDFYEQASLIIQDCETMYNSGVHAHFDNLATLPEKIKAKMLLVHYQDNILEDGNSLKPEWAIKETEAGFTYGFIMRGQDLDIDKMLF